MKKLKLHKTIRSLRLPKHHITAQDIEINASSCGVSQYFSKCKTISTQPRLPNKRCATPPRNYYNHNHQSPPEPFFYCPSCHRSFYLEY